jgi:hypothetical protein
VTLEGELRALADAFPVAPALAHRVMAATQRATAVRRRRRRVALLALALILLVPATALAVSGDLRDSVLQTFGLRNVRITTVPRFPEIGPEASRLQLGRKVSLAQARAALGSQVRPPTVLGAPDGIFVERLDSGADVSFLYEPRTVARRMGVRKRVLVSVVRGTIDKTILGKTIASNTKATPFDIDGAPALLLSGHAHLLVIFRARGGLDQTYARRVGTTLLVQRGDLLVRVEGDLPEDRLIAIVRSLTDA